MIAGERRRRAEGRRAAGRSRRRQTALAIFLLPLGLLLAGSCSKKLPAHPNVLLITLDTMRADHLGAYGSTIGATPSIDALASRGVRFENAESAVPLTLPSHATILSGLLPPHHGVRNNGTGTFPTDKPTIATLFAAKGYRTAAFTGAYVLDHKFGLNRGFDAYDDEIPRDPVLGDHLEAERSGNVVADRAIAWLSREDQRPFFAWVHLYDAHFPYVPPEPYKSRFASSAYDGEIAFVDEQVRRILEVLERTGKRENTIVVITGDHGEALGEHGELTHGLLLYEPTLRVPLIVSAPGELSAGVVKTPVSLVDIAPTIAGLAHLVFASKVDGRDLSPALRAQHEPAAADLYAETEYPALYGWSALAAMRRGAEKYISAPRPEVYDLGHDPGETRNLFGEERRVMRSLDAELKALRASTVTVPASAPDAETMAKLASLGYVGGTAPVKTDTQRADPKDRVGLFRRFEEATWATNDKRLDEAAATLAQLVEKDPQNPVFRASLAKVERQRGNTRRAIELYRDAVAYAPDDPQGWYNLASAFEEAGDMKNAGQAAREALRRDSGNADAHNVLGVIALNEGNAQEAMQEFERALEIDPRNARAYNNVGNLARSLRHDAEAENAYRKAIELAPNYPDPLNGLGALEIDRDRYREATAYFDRALAIAPQYLEARLNRAVALQLSGSVSAAIAEYQKYIAESANAPDLVRQREAAKQMVAKLQRTGA